MTLLDVGDVRLNVVVEGEGTPVVLLHGNGLSSRTWEPQLESLRSRRRVIAPDLRGFGYSDRIGPFSPQQMADDVAHICSALGESAVDVVGLSLGGLVALWTAVRHPARVRTLVVAGSGGGWGQGWREAVRAGRSALLDEGVEGLFAPFHQALWSPAIGERDPGLMRRVARELNSNDPKVLLQVFDAFEHADVYPHLRRIARPVLVVRGEHDVISTAETSQALVDAIPGARQAVVADAGHMCNLETPTTFDAVLTGFLAGVDTGAPPPHELPQSATT